MNERLYGSGYAVGKIADVGQEIAAEFRETDLRRCQHEHDAE